MSLRSLIPLCLLLLAIAPAQGAGRPAINYTLRFPEALHHYVEVEAVIPSDGAETVDLFMPVWTPGSYLLREYARNIDRVTATDANGGELPVTKTTKNRWQVATGGQPQVHVHYRIYGWEINVRSNWIEGDFAMINGAPTFIAVVDQLDRAYHVQLELPAGWTGTYTALPAGDRPHHYIAPDFDTLIDSPILAGSPQVDSFEIDGVKHYLVTTGGAGVWDNARAARHFEQIARTQVGFWGGLPYAEPYYVFNLLSGQRGGLEHRQGFVMMADRWLSRSRAGLNSWLSLVSHEYFHAWNGKRLRPEELGPFPYEHEAYTKTLWVVEGITSYYQHVLLRRAGFYTQKDYLNTLSGLIAGIERTPGRLVQSLSESSFDTWIKAYRPDENSVNTRISYYSGGALAAALLDAELRRVSDGAASLDDVMRAAFERFSGDRGYSEEEFIDLLTEIAGTDLAPWYRANIQTPAQFDYQPLLDTYGLRFESPKTPERKLLPNKLEPPDPESGWLGLDYKVEDGRIMVTSVRHGTPAYDAGLYVQDEVVAINGFRVDSNPLRLLQTYPPGEEVTLLISRRGQLLTRSATLAVEPKQTFRLEIHPEATPEQKARLEAWVGADEAAKEPTTAAADS